MSPRWLLAGFGGWMAALVGAYYLIPAQPLTMAIGASGAAAVVVGVVRYRPRRRVPWLLVGLAMLLFAVGDAIYAVQALGEQNPFPSVGDLFYLAMYPVLAAGLLLLPRSATGRDRAGMVDALILTAGLGLLSWIFLINPYIEAPDLGILERLTLIAYPLSDVLFLAAAARTVTAVRRTPAVGLMAFGALSLLVTDVIYGLAQLSNTWEPGGPVDLGWFVYYAMWGAAALHPSMVSLTEPRVVRSSRVTSLRIAVLTLSALIAPAVLLAEGVVGNVQDGVAIATMSAVIFLLVLLRLAGVARDYRLAVDRERGLREAGASLVSATDVDTVKAAVRVAVGRLFPSGAAFEVSLTLADEAGAVVAGHSPTARFVKTRDLDPHGAHALSVFELALVNDLVVDDRPSGGPYVGTLVVAADDDALGMLRGAVEVLASQAALAIERITLSNEIARRNSEEYFRTLVHNSADVILILNDDNRIRYASPSARSVFGGAPLTGRPLRDLVYPTHRELAWQILELVRAGHDGSGIADWSVVGGDGQLVEVAVSCQDLRREDTVRGLVLTLRDVTEQRRLERELTHRAYHDALTGLGNRVLFSEQVQQAVARTRHSGSIVGVLFIDLDDFKVVNDTMGHEIGDQLLAAVGARLTGALRANDKAARLGGDEFAVLIEDTHDPMDVEYVAERIVKTLAEPIVLGGSLLNASTSIGVATTVDASGAGDLLRQADLALYVAKGAGKGRWRRYQSALHTAMVERMALRSALDRAVADGDFALQYQPIVSLDDGRTIGFEALVRWQHPTRGLVPPREFIDVAEDSGLIVAIGGWVLRQALADASAWSRSPSQPQDEPQPRDEPYLSINVSARQFRAPGFVDRIRQELAASGVPAARLMLEITESLLLRDDEQVWSDLVTLRETGVRVAIDDFGTGYSSLSYLRQVPIDVVKIDKSFIDTMGSSPQQRALVEGIVRLAHTLGLEVVAEGIQRPADRALLVDAGCPFGQGFLFSGPLDEDDVVSWLHTDHVAA